MRRAAFSCFILINRFPDTTEKGSSLGFPPRFLDELRNAGLAGVIGKHEVDQARPRICGLSPFKAEKTPSFVVPEKGFYHDFASGGHGDIIDFVMKVESRLSRGRQKLASDAGMDVPRDTPEERARAKRRATFSTSWNGDLL